jgi:hypothetical protein
MLLMPCWYPITVQAYAGYRRNESPRSFQWHNQIFDVDRIVGQSYEQTLDRKIIQRFQVITSNGATCSLIYDSNSDNWYIETELTC